MEDIKEFTKGKSKGITSTTTVSRQTLNPSQNIPAGAKLPTPEKDVTAEAEKIADLLARIQDVMNSWQKATKLEIPKPLISTNHVIVALPLNGQVIDNSVTSEGKHRFTVNGKPITSEESEK